MSETLNARAGGESEGLHKPLWNWLKMWQDAEDRSLLRGDMPENKSPAELLEIAKERDKRFEEGAILAEREGDTEATWLCMAARRENQRFIDKLEQHLARSLTNDAAKEKP